MPGPPVRTIRAELKDVATSALGSLRRLNDHQIEQAQHPDYIGLATVYRQASQFPEIFKGFRVHHLDKVRNMPVGTTVLCLPMTAADCGWRAVITNVFHENKKHARFAWMRFILLVSILVSVLMRENRDVPGHKACESSSG